MEPPPSLKRSLMDVVEAEARERDPAAARVPWSRRLRDLLPRTGRPARGDGGTLLAIGLAVGFEVSELGAQQRRRSARSPRRWTRTRCRWPARSLRYEDDGSRGGVLHTQGLPALGGERVYQAWLQRDGRYVPQPTFMVGTDGQGAVALPDDLSKASAVLVTRERRGGAQQPTENPILTVDL